MWLARYEWGSWDMDTACARPPVSLPSIGVAAPEVAAPLCAHPFLPPSGYTSSLLADAMVIKGVRYRTYQSAVEAVFGRRGGILLAVIQYPNLVLTAIACALVGHCCCCCCCCCCWCCCWCHCRLLLLLRK